VEDERDAAVELRRQVEDLIKVAANRADIGALQAGADEMETRVGADREMIAECRPTGC
jgi:hypothetical protein